MRIVINTVDGRQHESREIHETEITPDKAVRTGDVEQFDFLDKHKNMSSLEDFRAFVDDCLTYRADLYNQTFTMETAYSTVKLNVCHVVSWRLVE